MDKKVFLTLENGRVFEGRSFGAERESIGELVFTTGMTGYLETLTDPSYFGQIVLQTFPLIGNYGVIPEDLESGKCRASGYIVRERCEFPSNFRCQMTIGEYLKLENIPAVYGVDTREIAKIIREAGVMNAAITFQPLTDFGKLRSYRVKNAVLSVTPDEVSVSDEKGDCTVVLYDFGSKRNIERELLRRGCRVITVPATYPAEEVLRRKPDGVMLSNGPGDPSENVEIVKNIRRLIGKLPIFGICLGHQLFALAMGGETRKMKYGHRGANQPVKDLATGKVYITSQNHGYEVVSESLAAGRLSFINCNDGTCEGVDYPSVNAFTVQFHPEACGGPLDANFLFDRFIGAVRAAKGEAKCR